MAQVGSLVFCIDCGNLLTSRGIAKSELPCDCCGKLNLEPPPLQTSTETKPSDFPSLLRQKLHSSVKTVERSDLQTQATIEETCPECGRKEVRFSQVQMRSADEGATNIYDCECGYRWTSNN